MQGARPSAAALRLDLASLQQQLLEASEQVAKVEARADEFEAQIGDLPAAIAEERARGERAVLDVFESAQEQVQAPHLLFPSWFMVKCGMSSVSSLLGQFSGSYIPKIYSIR
jgi:hypothetical protein